MVNDLHDGIDEHIRSELNEPVEIEEWDEFPQSYYLEARKWKRIEDCVVVAGDLTNSTQLGFGRQHNTGARIYESATGGVIRVVTASMFHPEFVDIQGDGFFAIFHGEHRYERALCCAITVTSMSKRVLVPRLEAKFGEDIPETGFKVGIASGTLLVKNVGVRGTAEPVWAGRPVNWAVKCAQSTGPHSLVVTPSVWRKVEENDYVRYSCGCSDGSWWGKYSDLWDEHEVEKLPDSDCDCFRCKHPCWCEEHGDEFCEAILDGQTEREEIDDWF